MKKLLILFIFILGSFGAKAEENAKIGPFSVDLKFCRDIDKWSGILSAYSNIQLPVTGVPGIMTGMLSTTSPLIDFCQYLTQMASLDTEGQIFKTLEYANKLSGNQHDDEMNLLQETWGMTTTIYDMEKGGFKKGVWESASTHRRLNRLIRTAGDYYDKKSGTDTPLDIQTRAEAERDMERLARLSYRRALINETMKCPKPDQSNEEFNTVYDKEIAPQEEMIEQLSVYTDFYRMALLSMGPKFLNKKEINDYIDSVNRLALSSSYFFSEVKQKKAETTRMRSVNDNKRTKATDPKVESYKEKINLNYQVFKVRVETSILQQFTKKYAKKWRSYTTNQGMQSSRGMLTDEQGGYGFMSGNKRKVEDEFKDFSLLCNKGKIAQRFDRNDPEFENKRQQAYDQCVKTTSSDIRKQGGLLEYYAQDLFQKERRIKELRGNIWTAESFYLGRFRNITEGQSKDSVDGFAQQEVQCAPINNLATLNQMSLKQQAANAELNQMIVEQLFKQNSLREAELADKRKKEEEAKRLAEIEKERQRRKNSEYHPHVNIPDPQG